MAAPAASSIPTVTESNVAGDIVVFTDFAARQELPRDQDWHATAIDGITGVYYVESRAPVIPVVADPRVWRNVTPRLPTDNCSAQYASRRGFDVEYELLD